MQATVSIYEAPRRRIDQSDVIDGVYFWCDDSRRRAVLLTPVCDIELDKTDTLTFCAAFPAYPLIARMVRGPWSGQVSFPEDPAEPLSSKQEKAIKNRITSVMKNFSFPRYHWLDPIPGEREPVVLDFQYIACYGIDELFDQLDSGVVKRACSVKSPWREQIPARYASYMARVGVEDKPAVEVEGQLRGCLNHLVQMRGKTEQRGDSS